MKKIAVLCLSLILLMSAGCAPNQTNRYQAEFLELFDTVTRIVGYSDSEEHFKEFAGQVRDKIKEYHQLYDIYNDYPGVNNIKTVNDSAGKAPVVVDRRIIDLLKFAKDECDATNGGVNIALGAVLSIWHDYREAGIDDPENAKLPPMDQLEEAALHTDIDNIVINENASTVYLSDPLMRLDVGAVAKGYATEQVALYFESQGTTSLLLSIGGNVRAIGAKLVPGTNGDKRWTVGIQNPDKESAQTELMNVLIDGFSVVSSGIYERYYTVDGVNYHHIIDPATLMPSTCFAQLTILSRDSGLGDALSTAVFNMPLDEGRAYIDSLKDVEAVWVMKDGAIEYSGGFKDYIKPAS
jgi:thiamine biosynthesis lipoprotein